MKIRFKITLIGIALLAASCAVTQNPVEIQRDEALHQLAVEAIRDNDFVLEAYQLQFRQGTLVNVSDVTNFISMSDGVVSIQTAFNNGRAGANNLGGVTLEGHPSDIKISTDKRGNTLLQMQVMGAVLSARVELTLLEGSNKAYAVVIPTFSNNRLTLYGHIVPAETSRVFKGRGI